MALDRKTGKTLWSQPAPVQKFEATHRLGNPATPTPVTDGERAFVYFGSYGLLAYDFGGRELWKKPLGQPVVEFGTSASPILAGDRLILLCDQDLGSYLLAVDKKSGQTLWRVERPEFRRSFATPYVWKHGSEEELVVPGSLWLKSYDLKDGSELWTVSGTSRVACRSPTSGDDLLFSASWNVGGDADSRISMPPFEEFAREHDKNKDQLLTLDELPAGAVKERFTQMDINKDGIVTPAEWQGMAEMFAKAGNAIFAVRPGGRGDITKTHVVWKSTRSLPYVSSPLFHDGRVYTMKNGGLASCYNARTGEVLYQDERVGAPGDYYASAVAVKDRVYLPSEEGKVVVLNSGDKFEVLARNDLGEKIYASPAIVDGKIYIRSLKYLSAFGVEP
jgi:outer membrane protein assembly factor BamB